MPALCVSSAKKLRSSSHGVSAHLAPGGTGAPSVQSSVQLPALVQAERRLLFTASLAIRRVSALEQPASARQAIAIKTPARRGERKGRDIEDLRKTAPCFLCDNKLSFYIN
jgi:hypothetical protein